MNSGSSVLLGVIAAALAGACTSGNPSGGDARFDAGPVPVPPMLCHPKLKPLGDGHTWVDLYQDYFGPAGGANCGGVNPANCHGQSDGKGAMASNFVCPPTRDDCYAGMTKGIKSTLPSNVPAGTPAKDTILIQILRTADGTSGSMPKSPVCSFDTNDFQRITDWIKAGAPNDGVEDAGTDAAPDADTGDAGDAGPG
ncbi:MAG: hypothetical protein ABIP39_11855 [Polyangiaceae bacterium]